MLLQIGNDWPDVTNALPSQLYIVSGLFGLRGNKSRANEKYSTLRNHPDDIQQAKHMTHITPAFLLMCPVRKTDDAQSQGKHRKWIAHCESFPTDPEHVERVTYDGGAPKYRNSHSRNLGIGTLPPTP